jgi:cytochrome c oxidase subunit 4
MQHGRSEPNYMAVFYWLAALTAIEVGVTFLPLLKLAIGIILVVLAFTKAALVALYFMHLKFERKTLAVVALTPVILCIFLMFMLVPERFVAPFRAATTSQQSATPAPK